MARLRFPGRPGHRFGRIGVSYVPNDKDTKKDKHSAYISNIHKGLRYFQELFGDSDEDVSTCVLSVACFYIMFAGNVSDLKF